MRTGSFHNRHRTTWIRLVILGLCLVTGALVMVPASGAQSIPQQRPLPVQNVPAPPPDPVPVFYDATGLFTDAQMKTLQSDATRLRSIKIPTLVYVRTADSAYADPDQSQHFADDVRASWGIASAPGADDGLVVLVTLDRQGAYGHSMALSYGAGTFARSGLTPEYIRDVFARHMQPLLDDGRPFDALSVGMRRIRYGGIYFPPPVAPLTGAAATVHQLLAWVGPLSVIGCSGLFVAVALSRKLGQAAQRSRIAWPVAGGAAVLMVLAVYGRSGTGIASALLILVSLAIQLWLWSRQRRADRRTVPATRRRLSSARPAEVRP